MKKLGILFATITMAMLFVISANAKEIAPAGQCGDNVYWSYNETTGELIINGNGYMWNYNYGSSPFSYSDIKNVIIEYGVTSIGNSTFSSCQYLTSITIPDSVKTIGASAFNGCYKLGDVVIPNSVEIIDNGAFFDCHKLKNVFIGSGVNSISRSAFSYCYNIDSFSVSVDNTSFSTDINGVLFNKNKTVLIKYPAGNWRTSYEIPFGVKDIAYQAFMDSENLFDVALPDSLITIDERAFHGCRNLNQIEIPKSLTKIGEMAFGWCTSIVEFKVDSANDYYSNDDFGVLFNKDKTKLIQYPAQYNNNYYEIPNGTKYICIGAFQSCYYLYGISIPNTVYYIDEIAFRYCYKLKDIRIPKGVAVISNSAFSGCDSLESVIIEEGVTSIGDCAFSSCTKLKEIVIPNSITNVGYSVFWECDNLLDIYYMSDSTNWDKLFFESDTIAKVHYNCLYKELYPTCISDGHTLGLYCPDCGWISGEVIDKLPHCYGDYISDGKATCITDGSLTAKCDYCDATDTKPEKGTHKFSDGFTIDLDPTCTTDGQKSRHCLNCTEKTDITPIGKLGHTYNTITIDPTCTDRGHKIYTCLCGDSYTETLPALGHNFVGSACTECDYDKSFDCSCNCHKSGIPHLIFKIILFFQKLFGQNKVCACGVKH